VTAKLAVIDLSVAYPGRSVISGLSYNFTEGVNIVVGPNGSGKTSLLHVLAGILQPERGRVEFNGDRVADRLCEYKLRVGFVPDKLAFYEFVTGAQFLGFVAKAKHVSVRGLKDGMAFVDCLGGSPHLSTPLGAMSVGTLKKFFIAAALLASPKILLLDEPFNGLDQTAREACIEVFERLATEGTICVVADHHRQLAGVELALSVEIS